MNFIKKILKYISRIIDIFITKIDSDKAKSEFGSYRVELKFFIENNLDKIDGKILDLGSGTWTWIKDRLKDKENCYVTSFDRFKHPNVDVQGDLFELDKYFELGNFDSIVCLDVVEHVNNPFKAINAMSGVLKSNGLLLISCPFDKELHGEDYGDYWRITRQGWQELLKNDFKKIEINSWGYSKKPKAYFIKAFKK